MVEFVNRLFTGVVSIAVIAAVLGAYRRDPYRRDLTLWSWGLVAGVVAQIIWGGFTVLSDLHPAVVAGHFLISMVLMWNAVVLSHRASRPDDSLADPPIRDLSTRTRRGDRGLGRGRPPHRAGHHRDRSPCRGRTGPPFRLEPHHRGAGPQRDHVDPARPHRGDRRRRRPGEGCRTDPDGRPGHADRHRDPGWRRLSAVRHRGPSPARGHPRGRSHDRLVPGGVRGAVGPTPRREVRHGRDRSVCDPKGFGRE